MVPKLTLFLLLLSPSVLTQFGIDSLQPDVKFSEGNDRFDLTAMIHDTNRKYHENQLAPDDEDYRRKLNSNEEDLHILDDLREDRPKNGPASLSARRYDDSFVYHDRMDDNEGGTLMDFEDNLEHFKPKTNFNVPNRRMGAYMNYLHGRLGRHRRNNSPNNEQEVLMHYAMPIVMTIDGFLKAPIESSATSQNV